MTVEDNQARRLLNDLASFAAHYDLGREDRHSSRAAGCTEIFEPIMAMIPPDATGKLEPAEIFHEILEHRWYLSEQAGHEVNIHATARDYIDRFLTAKPDEAITGQVDGLPLADLPRAVGAQPHPLQPDRSPVAVGHQADLGVAPRLAAHGDGVRRAAGRAVGVGVAGAPFSPTTRVGPFCTWSVPAEHQVGAAAREHLAAEVGVVHQHRG